MVIKNALGDRNLQEKYSILIPYVFLLNFQNFSRTFVFFLFFLQDFSRPGNLFFLFPGFPGFSVCTRTPEKLSINKLPQSQNDLQCDWNTENQKNQRTLTCYTTCTSKTMFLNLKDDHVIS